MKPILFYTIIFSIFSLHACQEKETPSTPLNKGNKIILIFENAPINKKHQFPEGMILGMSSEVQYVDDNFLEREIILKYNQLDTISIETNRDILTISHTYKGTESLSFLFEKGDTVLISYDENQVPIPKIVNRTHTSDDYTFEQLCVKKYKNGFSAATNYFHPYIEKPHLMRFKNPENFARAMEKAKKELLPVVEKEYQDNLEQLKTLKQENKVSPLIFDFYNQQLRSKHLEFQLRHRLITIESYLSNFDSTTVFNDLDALYLPYNLSYARKSIKNFNKIPEIQVKNGRYVDFRKEFEIIQKKEISSLKLKNAMLYESMRGIIENFHANDIDFYLKAFEKEEGSESYINDLKQKFNINSTITNDLHLENVNGEIVTFDNFIKNNQGKVIYIDFWASWCAPCRKMFPASHSLQKTYQNKAITFVYISKDDDRLSWLNANEKEDLAPHSYRITNQYQSTFIEELNIKSIPRYLLYDRTGKLVYQNAPRPNEARLKEFIDDLL